MVCTTIYNKGAKFISRNERREKKKCISVPYNGVGNKALLQKNIVNSLYFGNKNLIIYLRINVQNLIRLSNFLVFRFSRSKFLGKNNANNKVLFLAGLRSKVEKENKLYGLCEKMRRILIRDWIF